jgi:uncharacterized protein (TIGR02594 family)
LLEALKIFGTAEMPGPNDNPSILSWAKATGQDIYKHDSMAWCGLTMAYVALQAGWDLPVNPLGARNWLTWGTEVPIDKPCLGDIVVFWRGIRNGYQGHVAMYVGQNDALDEVFVLGGNQLDRVCIEPKPKSRILGVRRCPWKVNQPGNVRPIHLSASGIITSNEA